MGLSLPLVGLEFSCYQKLVFWVPVADESRYFPLRLMCICACAPHSARSADHTSHKASRWAGPTHPQGRDAVLTRHRTSDLALLLTEKSTRTWYLVAHAGPYSMHSAPLPAWSLGLSGSSWRLLLGLRMPGLPKPRARQRWGAGRGLPGPGGSAPAGRWPAHATAPRSRWLVAAGSPRVAVGTKSWGHRNNSGPEPLCPSAGRVFVSTRGGGYPKGKNFLC